MSEKRPIITKTGHSTPTEVRVRGLDLINELMGRYTYTEMLYFLTCHRFPTVSETKVLDACLVTLMEHGLTPSAVISRLMRDSVPNEPQVAIASGLLAIGSVFAGTTEDCADLLLKIKNAAGDDLESACRDVAKRYAEQRMPVPGFGHGTHKPDDPRTPRLLEIAKDAGASTHHVDILLMLSKEVDKALGRHITINATGAIGALFLDIGIPMAAMRSFSVVSRAGGLVGHVLEDQETRSGRAIWQAAKQTVPYNED